MSRRFFIKSLTIQALGLFAFPQILKSANLTLPNHNGGEDDLTTITRLLQGEKPATWLFTGDSITHGAKHTHGMRSFPEIFAERVRWELKRVNDTVINTGISGHTSQDILDGFDARIARFTPDVVFLMIGTNDASTGKNIPLNQYGTNLNLLIDRLRETGSIPVLISPNRIIMEQAPQRSRLEEYVNQMRQIVSARNVVFVDMWKIWGDELQDKYNGKANDRLLNDALHPNGYGHQEIAIAIFKELSIFDALSPACISEPAD